MPTQQSSRYDRYSRGHGKLSRLQIMIIAKLILFASPIFVASMLFLANPAAAFNIDSASHGTHVNAKSVQSVHHVVVLNNAEKSNPILDALACQCATCTQAKLQLEGKLSISDILSN